jgi:hypothetical protein
LESQHHHHHHHHPAVTPSTPLLNRCCCFSLLTGAVLTGIYATVKQSFTIVLLDHLTIFHRNWVIASVLYLKRVTILCIFDESRKSEKMVSQLTSCIKCQVLCVWWGVCATCQTISVFQSDALSKKPVKYNILPPFTIFWRGFLRPICCAWWHLY